MTPASNHRQNGHSTSDSYRKPPRPPGWSFLALLLTVLTICSKTFAQLTLSTTSLPLIVNLPSLNTSTQSFDLSIVSPDPITSLYLTLSICSLGSNTSIIPAVLVTTNPGEFDIDDNSVSDRDSGGVEKANRRARGGDVWSLAWDKGFANWTYIDDSDRDDGGIEEVVMRIGFSEGQDISDGNVVIQLGASNDEPLQRVSTEMLYLGDTTSTQSLIFSPLLLPSPQTQPTYPNYTLPPAQLAIPPLPEFSFPTYDLLVIPTSSSPTNNGLDNSHCAALNANVTTGALGQSNLVVNATTEWMSIGDEEGYRTYWVIGGLQPGSNYTAWFLEPGTRTLSQPIWFTTKQSSFPCQLVLPNPYCPSIAYAAPVPTNSTILLSAAAPLTSLPESINLLLTQSLDAFATSLSSKACGRDYYSHTSSCLDCHTAYRDWICRMALPRCIDPPPTDILDQESSIIPPRSVPRKASGLAEYDYQELLPCLGTCNRVDRTCPAWLGFGCPYRGINANETYGFFGQDDGRGDGAKDPGGGGVRSSDRWGNRWCNGP